MPDQADKFNPEMCQDKLSPGAECREAAELLRRLVSFLSDLYCQASEAWWAVRRALKEIEKK